MIHKNKPHRSDAFLRWAKRQAGPCCVCGEAHGVELHHWGPAGMGQKGSDLLVCRVCRRCHGEIQGKRRRAFERSQLTSGAPDNAPFKPVVGATWADILEDSIALLEGWAKHLERKDYENGFQMCADNDGYGELTDEEMGY